MIFLTGSTNEQPYEQLLNPLEETCQEKLLALSLKPQSELELAHQPFAYKNIDSEELLYNQPTRHGLTV